MLIVNGGDSVIQTQLTAVTLGAVVENIKVNLSKIGKITTSVVRTHIAQSFLCNLDTLSIGASENIDTHITVSKRQRPPFPILIKRKST